jgi:hypothetical protein
MRGGAALRFASESGFRGGSHLESTSRVEEIKSQDNRQLHATIRSSGWILDKNPKIHPGKPAASFGSHSIQTEATPFGQPLVVYSDGSINAAASDVRRADMTDPDQQRRTTGGTGRSGGAMREFG